MKPGRRAGRRGRRFGWVDASGALAGPGCHCGTAGGEPRDTWTKPSAAHTSAAQPGLVGAPPSHCGPLNPSAAGSSGRRRHGCGDGGGGAGVWTGPGSQAGASAAGQPGHPVPATRRAEPRGRTQAPARALLPRKPATKERARPGPQGTGLTRAAGPLPGGAGGCGRGRSSGRWCSRKRARRAAVAPAPGRGVSSFCAAARGREQRGVDSRWPGPARSDPGRGLRRRRPLRAVGGHTPSLVTSGEQRDCCLRTGLPRQEAGEGALSPLGGS